jgi:hypothetical protein
MGLSDQVKKAEELSQEHPKQVDEGIEKGMKAAEEETGHRHDKEIGEAGEQIERRLGGEAGDDQQQQQQEQQQQQPQQDGQGSDENSSS